MSVLPRGPQRRGRPEPDVSCAETRDGGSPALCAHRKIGRGGSEEPAHTAKRRKEGRRMPIFPMGRLGSANVSRTERVQHVARNRRQEAEKRGTSI